MTTKQLNVDKEIVGKILAENLGMKVSAEMMSQILSDDSSSGSWVFVFSHH